MRRDPAWRSAGRGRRLDLGGELGHASFQFRDPLRHRRRQIVLLPRVGLEVEEEVVVVVARVDRFAAAYRELQPPAALAIGTETAAHVMPTSDCAGYLTARRIVPSRHLRSPTCRKLRRMLG